MSTPDPCANCFHLYADCLYEDDPSYGAQCKLKKPMGMKDCDKFVRETCFRKAESAPATLQEALSYTVGDCLVALGAVRDRVIPFLSKQSAVDREISKRCILKSFRKFLDDLEDEATWEKEM